MLFKNLEIHGVSHAEKEPDAELYKLYRLPLSVHQALNPGAMYQNCSTRAVELRFVMLSEKVTIRLKAKEGSFPQAPTIYFGNIYADSSLQNQYIYDHISDVVIEKPSYAKEYIDITQKSGFPYSSEVVRILLPVGIYYIADVEGDIMPPSKDMLPPITYLSYGSSITHGFKFNNYIAEHFGADLLNYGYSGSAYLEPEVADYISMLPFDFATIEMGVNMLKDTEPAEYQKRVHYFVQTFVKNNAEKHVFFTDVFYVREDYFGNERVKAYRKIAQEEVLAANHPFIHYTNGLSLLGGAHGLNGDLVHPNENGAREIATNFISVIQKYI